MARQKRQIMLGNVYHVINRGVEKRNIFIKPQDYSRFILGLYHFNDQDTCNIWATIRDKHSMLLPALEEIPKKDERKRIVDILAFTLMPNHFHLILRETSEGGISSFMKKMGGYSTYFNKQYKRVGPLFQSRYKDILIKSDGQFSTVFAYVHANPVELWEQGWKNYEVKNPKRAIELLDDYKWSSYGDYVGKKIYPNVTQRKIFMDFFENEKNCRSIVEDWIKYKAKKEKMEGKLEKETVL